MLKFSLHIIWLSESKQTQKCRSILKLLTTITKKVGFVDQLKLSKIGGDSEAWQKKMQSEPFHKVFFLQI
jgi:hypothetical protein